MNVAERVARLAGAAALLFVALRRFQFGFDASDDAKGQKYFGFLEGEWFFWFALVPAGACVWAAVRLAKSPGSGGGGRD